MLRVEKDRSFWATAFNLDILNQKRITWIDYLRGIIIIFVVYHHAYLGIDESNIPVPRSVSGMNMVFYSFRMPLFFVISGIFIGTAMAKKSFGALTKIKFNTLLYPYFIWAFIQLSLQILSHQFTNSQRSLTDYFFLFYQPRQLDQFWYLPALFNATMVFVLLKRFLDPAPWLHLLVAFGFYLLAPFLQEISILTDWMRFYFFFVLGDLFSHLFFKEKLKDQLRKPASLLMILPVFFFVQLYSLQNHIWKTNLNESIETASSYGQYFSYQVEFLVIAIIGGATLVIIAFLLERWKKLNFLRILGYHSLYIYVIHVIVVGFVRTALFWMGVTNLAILLPLCIVAGIILPIMFYNLIGKDKLWFLFAPHKEKVRRTNSKTVATDDSFGGAKVFSIKASAHR